jgi:hypothetical protein
MQSPAQPFRQPRIYTPSQHMFQPDLALSLVHTFFLWFTATQLAVATIVGLCELSRLF